MSRAASRVRTANKKSNHRTASYRSSRHSDTSNHARRHYLGATSADFRHPGFIHSRSRSSARRHHSPVGRSYSRANHSGTVSRYYRYGRRSGQFFKTSRKCRGVQFTPTCGRAPRTARRHLLIRTRSSSGFLSA